ncbi:hypothetical protein DFH09DRAFT_1342248 [Mycena vulgaris]|nr:hypothetical protein DFH09DRAFT_1342248 [Mycena vulgaris]
MSANGQYYDPKLTQPAPSYYQGAPHGGQPLAQPYYNMSQPQMQAAPQPQIFVNVNQSQKQKGGSGCCAWWAFISRDRHRPSRPTDGAKDGRQLTVRRRYGSGGSLTRLDGTGRWTGRPSDGGRLDGTQ